MQKVPTPWLRLRQPLSKRAETAFRLLEFVMIRAVNRCDSLWNKSHDRSIEEYTNLNFLAWIEKDLFHISMLDALLRAICNELVTDQLVRCTPHPRDFKGFFQIGKNQSERLRYNYVS